MRYYVGQTVHYALKGTKAVHSATVSSVGRVRVLLSNGLHIRVIRSPRLVFDGLYCCGAVVANPAAYQEVLDRSVLVANLSANLPNLRDDIPLESLRKAHELLGIPLP